MEISKELLPYVNNGDLNLGYKDVKYSTNLRSIVSVGFMIEWGKQIEEDERKKEAASAITLTA